GPVVLPVGEDATTLVSGLSGTPDEQPRIKPPVLITSAMYLVCGSRPAASSVARILASWAFAWLHVNGNVFDAATDDVVKLNWAAGNARCTQDWNSAKSTGRTLLVAGPEPTAYVSPTTRICSVGGGWNVEKFALPIPMMLLQPSQGIDTGLFGLPSTSSVTSKCTLPCVIQSAGS